MWIESWPLMDLEQLYQQRLTRYLTAMRNEKPDRVPIRPFVAEFTAKYAGFTCQDVAHDYTQSLRSRRQNGEGLRLGRGRRQHGVCLDRPRPGRRACATTAFRESAFRTPAGSTISNLPKIRPS